MKNILVITDSSRATKDVSSYAIQLAAGNADKVIFAGIIELTDIEGLPPSTKTYREQINFLSNAIVKVENDFELLRCSLGIPCEQIQFIVEVGNLPDCLFKIVCEYHIDLVIITS